MAVRKKKRRAIMCGGKKYVWYVLAGDRDYWDHLLGNNWETPFLHIISEDKKLILTIPLNAPKPYAVSKGAVFQGKTTSGCWERYLLPFDMPEIVTPRFVSEIIDWAVGSDSGAAKVEYDGRDIGF